MEFFIYTEKMAFERIKRCQQSSIKIIANQGLSEIVAFNKSVWMTLRSDKSANAAMGDAQAMLFNWLKTVEGRSVDDVYNDNLEDFYELCSMFIYTKGEDMTTVEPEHMKMKIDVWKKHCDFHSFFLLGIKQLKQLTRKSQASSELDQESPAD